VQLEVWDKERLGPDQLLGTFCYTFQPEGAPQPPPTGVPHSNSWSHAPQQPPQQQPQRAESGWLPSGGGAAAASSGHLDFTSQLQPGQVACPSGAGTLNWSLSWERSSGTGYPGVSMPVRWAQNLSPLAGAQCAALAHMERPPPPFPPRAPRPDFTRCSCLRVHGVT